MPSRLQTATLYFKLLLYALHAYSNHFRRRLTASGLSLLGSSKAPAGSASDPDGKGTRNIVIVGAAFAGYHAARTIATSLPRGTPYRVVVVEPNSHFHFTWVLPRFCVISDHEHKAFIPYGGYLAGAAPGIVRWVRARVETVGRASVKLDTGAEIPYEFLVVATGASVPHGLPSRVGATEKDEGVRLLRAVQARIRDAQSVVVAGGGAAGVEVATDAKAAYPDKRIVLVHSRQAVMHRFSPGLQKATLEALERLGVEVVLGEKVVSHDDADARQVVLTSGKTVECDCYVDCTGQRPSSGVLASLAPAAISESGHIRVKPTLQILDDSLPHIYACGDVADTHTPNPNARSAMTQAETVADNILLAIRGKGPRYTYAPRWGDGLIKLTLGLDRSILQFWDGKNELLFPSVDKDVALLADGAWKNMGAEPFTDTGPMKEGLVR